MNGRSLQPILTVLRASLTSTLHWLWIMQVPRSGEIPFLLTVPSRIMAPIFFLEQSGGSLPWPYSPPRDTRARLVALLFGLSSLPLAGWHLWASISGDDRLQPRVPHGGSYWDRLTAVEPHSAWYRAVAILVAVAEGIGISLGRRGTRAARNMARGGGVRGSLMMELITTGLAARTGRGPRSDRSRNLARVRDALAALFALFAGFMALRTALQSDEGHDRT